MTGNLFFALNFIMMLVWVIAGAGCQSPPDSATENNISADSAMTPLVHRRGTVYDEWGIETKAVMLSGEGNLLDFRFKVLDAQKAQPLFGNDKNPVLIDQSSGASLIVPAPPKAGPLRQTMEEPREGRIHFILFANPGRLVERGDLVTVVIDDFRAENLVVE